MQWQTAFTGLSSSKREQERERESFVWGEDHLNFIHSSSSCVLHVVTRHVRTNSISNLTKLKICMQKFFKYIAHILDICGKCPAHKRTLFHCIRQREHLHCFWKVVCTICEMIGKEIPVCPKIGVFGVLPSAISLKLHEQKFVNGCHYCRKVFRAHLYHFGRNNFLLV